jgi:DNA-binding LacI/PurR family transcriptional regulator
VRSRRPTIADVAARAGVSKGAVSFALNDRPGVAPDTRQRILAAAAELGWEPSLRARGLTQSRAYALGLVLARPPHLLGADPFFSSFIAGVETELAPRGLALVLQVVPDEEAETEGYRRLAREGRVDGVLLTDLRVDDTRLSLLDSLGLPAVSLGRPDVPTTFPSVVHDEAPGVAAAVDHLVACGHRRIAHVTGADGYLHSRHRHDAYVETARRHGLVPGPVADGDFTAAGGAAAMRRLLAADPRPTAVVFANDAMALAGLTVAAEHGLTVPDDLSVTGYDDIELASHAQPPLTTVRGDPLPWGQAATRALLTLVEDGAAPDTTLPPARLVRRGSSGPAPTDPTPV